MYAESPSSVGTMTIVRAWLRSSLRALHSELKSCREICVHQIIVATCLVQGSTMIAVAHPA